MDNVKRISSCEVCGNTTLVPLLNLGFQPMCDDLVPIDSQAVPQSYPLEVVGCEECLTVHQAYQIEKKLLFPQSYHYRAALTKDVILGMQELVDSVEQSIGDLTGKRVLDVGCNDGSLLSIFGARGASTYGIEPTGAAEDARPNAGWIYNGFFDSDSVDAYLAKHAKPDVITFTNVFAHIEDLNGVLDNLLALMMPSTKLVIENHYLGAVVRQKQFDTFYHEHPRTYSFESFRRIAQKLGRNIERVEFPERYSGNIRVFMGPGSSASTPTVDERGYISAITDMQEMLANARNTTQNELSKLAGKHGPLPAKAFPARASILVHCLGLDHTIIDATYERSNSPKVGNYIPGTKIEIRDEAEFLKNRLGSPVLINFAWHIQKEIQAYMREMGYTGEVLPIWKQ